MSDSLVSPQAHPAADESMRANANHESEFVPGAIAQESGVLRVSRVALAGVLLLAGMGLLSSFLLWQKLGSIQEELARRSLDAGAQSIEARTLARAAQDATRDMSARLALQESRLSEVSLQRAQLEQLMQSLSQSRDETLVVDVESALRLAQQQAQLAGSAEPLIAALLSADQRLVRAAQPRLNPLQRAIAKDLDHVRAVSLTDVPVLLLKIDELARMVDDLPLANGMVTSSAVTDAQLARTAPAGPLPAPNRPASAPKNSASVQPAAEAPARFDTMALRAWFDQAINAIYEEARKLLRVSRIDQPEASLMSPEQSFFLRENLKLRLLNARLALLSRQTESARADLQTASVWLNKYFDRSARRTQAATQFLQQIQSQLKVSELPRLDETMSALATAAAGR